MRFFKDEARNDGNLGNPGYSGYLTEFLLAKTGFVSSNYIIQNNAPVHDVN